MALPLDDLLPELLPFAPACPDPVALKQLRLAAIEFCRQTKLWRTTLEHDVETPASEGIPVPSGSALFAIEAARLDGHNLTPVTLAWLDAEFPGWATLEDDAGCARYITQLTPDTVTIVPAATGTLTARLVLEPARDATTVPDFLTHYATLIGRGAAGQVLITPSADYANPTLGAALIREFADRLSALVITAAKTQLRAPLRTRSRYF